MTRILEYHGSQDGIRFGRILLGGGHYTKSFVFDRLNRIVRLFSICEDRQALEDTNPERREIALAALIAHEP